MSFEQKRAAERLPLDSPIDATAGGFVAKIVEMSAIGCKIEHKEKLSLNSTISVKFKWEDFPIDLPAKVMRQQLQPGMTYQSGLKFADSLELAPDVMRAIVASLAKKDLPPDIAIPHAPTQVVEEELDYSAADEFEDIPIPQRQRPPQVQYVECRLDASGMWHRRLVSAAVQPEDGFITVPAEDAELDELCKTYGYADPDTRRLIRISLELVATQKRD